MLTQKFFYPLYKQFEKDFFASLLNAINENYSFIGNEEDKVFFVKCLLCLQMIKDYRAPLESIKENLSKKTDLKIINDAIKSKEFIIDYSWAVWTHEKEMGRLAKNLFSSPLEIIGTNEEFNEFVLRYLISIWLVDWEGPLYALLQSTKDGKVNLDELNTIISLWDFIKIFASYKQS